MTRALPLPLAPSRPLASSRALDVVRWRVALCDVAVILTALLVAQAVRFRGTSQVLGTELSYLSLGVGIAAMWVVALRARGAYEAENFGHGVEEYRALASASFYSFAVVAMVGFATKIYIARGYLLVALPVGILLLCLERWLWRIWLVRRRARGELLTHVLVAGNAANVRHLAEAFHREPGAGFVVAGVCADDFEVEHDDSLFPHLQYVGPLRDAVDRATSGEFHSVAWAGGGVGGPATLRQLGWALEGSNTELVVMPGLTDVAGPRVAARPIAGLPLLYVDTPRFRGPRLVVKRLLDVVSAAVLLMVSLPVQLVAAVGIWLHDRGPVLYRQTRVGIDGRPFTIYKFRSMVVDAEAREREMRAAERAGTLDPRFKDRHGTLTTPIGRFMRRHSLDELPQLYNVLIGTMSLVGPRPPLPHEVATYGADVRRRLLVRPGCTGLWQVNGRSDLTWDESVRLDLYYVENWSLLGDLVLLGKTVKTVLTGNGAY